MQNSLQVIKPKASYMSHQSSYTIYYKKIKQKMKFKE